MNTSRKRCKNPLKRRSINYAAQAEIESKITKNYLLNHINVDKAVDMIMKDIGEV